MNRPSETSSSGSPRTKPSTRSSIRHSLGLAGKAFADVINKDNRDSDKSSKKGKDASSRRHSVIGAKPTTPHTFMGDTKHPPQALRRVGTPESKTITRRRVSAGLQRSSMDEHPTKPADSIGITRSSTLRPRPHTSSSALPKYRAKSALMEANKPPPPSPQTGTRRPFVNSDSEKEDRREQEPKSQEKTVRPISPLPHRAALKANLSSAINKTPPTTPSKVKPLTPSSSKASPTRPAKLVKTTASVSVSNSTIPRPSSSTSSSSSFTPRTPKGPSLKNVTTRQAARERSNISPSPQSSVQSSPLARHSRKGSRNGSPAPNRDVVGNMSHISEGDNDDSDSDTNDVELLLAPVAALGAPTPAMPRIQTTRNRNRLPPQTPTRPNLLPTRANMSYLSPLPPDDDSSSSLRPPREGSGRQARGSILSWEQLATEASKTLGEDEIESMLSDVPAPFRPGAVSPTPSTGPMDIPESPCLSAMSSPGGYGSISQVLLPDVTPSPAMHNSQRYNMSSEIPAVDAAVVTLLRLQLASAENTAKERLLQLQTMEEEIHNLKEARVRETHELTRQVAYMEDQIRANMERQGRVEEERGMYTYNLEDKLRQEQTLRDQAIQEALLRSQESAREKQEAALESQRGSYEVICLARVASSEWAAVRELSEMELSIVQGDRQTLSVLLAELDQMCRTVL